MSGSFFRTFSATSEISMATLSKWSYESLSQSRTVSCTRNDLSYLQCLPQARIRLSSVRATAQEFLPCFHSRVQIDCLVGARARLTGIDGLETSRVMPERRTGRRVRIFVIDAKNRACQEGGIDAAVCEGVGVGYRYGERDHSVKCWNHPG